MSGTDAPGPDPGIFAGLQDQNGYGRTFAITANPDTTGYKALVSIRLTTAELAVHNVSADLLVLCRLDTTQTPAPGKWVVAGTNLGARIPTDSVGDAGRVLADDGSLTFWAVVDRVGTFAVGQPASSSTPGITEARRTSPARPHLRIPAASR